LWLLFTFLFDGVVMAGPRRGHRPPPPTGSIANNRDDGKMIGNCDRFIGIQMQIMPFLVTLFLLFRHW
jgi:hypothetical protein